MGSRLFLQKYTGVMMNKEESGNNNWSPCPPGTLMGLSSALKRREQIRRLQRIATMVAALLITIAAGNYAINQSSSVSSGPSYGGITCTDVGQSLPDFLSGRIDEGVRAKIESHLKQCSICASLARQLKEDQKQSADLQLPDQAGAAWVALRP